MMIQDIQNAIYSMADHMNVQYETVEWLMNNGYLELIGYNSMNDTWHWRQGHKLRYLKDVYGEKGFDKALAKIIKKEFKK